jgi:hypothetical protein
MVRRRILAEPDAAVAVKLKANPGQEFIIAAGPLENRGKYATVAWRIRTGRQAAFRPAGAFEASVSSKANEPDRVYPAELRCRFIPLD